jgi:hypothetical protein
MQKIIHNLLKKKVIIALIAVLFVGVSAVAVLYAQGYFKSKPAPSGINYSPPTSDEKAAGAATKSNTTSTSTGKSAGSSDTPPAPTAIPGSDKKSVQVSVTASSQNNGLYQVRALIGALTNDGTCTLVLTQGSKTVTKTAATQASATSSTCRGFDVPVSELAAGQWQLNLSVTSPSLIGSTTSTITVQ